MITTSSPAAGMTALPAAGSNWQAAGLCRETDPEIFFPEKGSPQAEAKRICLRCEVRTECLEYALEHGERGIWGATSTAQRRRILRDREETPAAAAVDPVKASRDQTIRRLTAEGFSAAEIAERVGCNKRTVVRARTAVAA